MQPMTIEQLCEGIHLPICHTQIREIFKEELQGRTQEEGEHFLEEIKKEAAQRKSLFWNEETKLFALFKEEGELGWKKAWYLYLQLALDVYPSYEKVGLAKEQYFANFIDFTIWNHKCREQHGINGICEYIWLALPLKQKIFRLGRLQFEPGVLGEAMKEPIHLEKDCPVLHVHIPEGEKLDYTEVIKSFQRAPQFFETYFHQIYEYCVCDSWLLGSNLVEILPKDSNIIKLKNLFCVYKEDYHSRQAEARVFGVLKSDPKDYPEKTTLQKNMKKGLICGKRYGQAGGIAVLQNVIKMSNIY